MRLSAEGLEVRRGSSVVLRETDLAVEGGEIVAVAGANGSGKSTLLATFAGLLRPWQGRIRLDGRRVDGWSPPRLVRAGLSLVPQGRRVFRDLTVRQNLEVGGWVGGRQGVAARAGAFLERHPFLAERADVAAGSLSGGEQSVLVLGRALMARPRVLLLDEPLMGLDPSAARGLLGHLTELAAEGVAVLVVDHDREALDGVASRVVVMAGGRPWPAGEGPRP